MRYIYTLLFIFMFSSCGFAQVDWADDFCGDGIFVRGDVNGDGSIDITDYIYLWDYLFEGGLPPCEKDAADFNDDGFMDTTDVVNIVNFVFMGGSAPAMPYPEPGQDNTPDNIANQTSPNINYNWFRPLAWIRLETDPAFGDWPEICGTVDRQSVGLVWDDWHSTPNIGISGPYPQDYRTRTIISTNSMCNDITPRTDSFTALYCVDWEPIIPTNIPMGAFFINSNLGVTQALKVVLKWKNVEILHGYPSCSQMCNNTETLKSMAGGVDATWPISISVSVFNTDAFMRNQGNHSVVVQLPPAGWSLLLQDRFGFNAAPGCSFFDDNNHFKLSPRTYTHCQNTPLAGLPANWLPSDRLQIAHIVILRAVTHFQSHTIKDIAELEVIKTTIFLDFYYIWVNQGQNPCQ